MKKIFSVVGEDARQKAAAEYLAQKGFSVVDAAEVYRADYILLPMPLDADREALAHILRAARKGALAFGGRVSPQVAAQALEAGILMVDYYAREELIQLNCVPTAEGCLEILLRELPTTLWESPVGVVGYGRVGQAVAARLAALGSRVTVAARRPGARAQARTQGCRAVSMEELPRLLPGLAAVVNTAPALVLPGELLALTRPGAVVVDLASRPGGVDFAAAAKLGVHVVQALSLPARCAPQTAGALVAQTVLNILAEKGESL